MLNMGVYHVQSECCNSAYLLNHYFLLSVQFNSNNSYHGNDFAVFGDSSDRSMPYFCEIMQH